jgi:transposase
MQVSTIGVDLAKNVFQVHGVDSAGKIVITRQLRRKQVIDFFSKIPPCLVGMEACGTAHHWAREVSKLDHTVRLMPRSSRTNSNREALPSAMKQALQAIVDQLAALELQIGTLDRAIQAHHRANDMSCRLETAPGIGVIGATAIASTVTDPNDFKSGRDFAAWIGLVPRQHSTGGKERLGGISKQGDRYLRRLLVIGATAVVRHARQHPQKHPWVIRLLAKKPAKLVAVAVANRMARIAWAIMAKGGYYRAPTLAAAA